MIGRWSFVPGKPVVRGYNISTLFREYQIILLSVIVVIGVGCASWQATVDAWKGRKLDDDIATLVKKGLDVRVQQALDVVRVIGNNAVHPGQIELRDDRRTAEKLFGLVNLIADIMISQPKHVGEMFGSLPEGARNAIQKRDRPKGEGS